MENNNMRNKYEEALAKYNCEINDKEVAEAVRKIIAEKVPQNDTPEVKRFLMGSIELTTLKTTDSDESVLAFTERVNQFAHEYADLPHVATICVYPCYAKTVSESLEVEGVEIADGATTLGKCVDSVGECGGIGLNLYGEHLVKVYQMTLLGQQCRGFLLVRCDETQNAVLCGVGH